jgi:undecaprenyl-diphosphatase
MLITILQAIILGIVQGATEFIPISSSAHLIIIPWLFGWTNPALTSLPFDVALHLGTLIAVLWYFAQDWVTLISAGFASIKERKIGADLNRRMAWFVVIGTIPGAVVGMLAESKIESLFHEPGVPIQPTAMIIVGVILAAMAGVLYLADHLATHVKGSEEMTLKDTLIIGFAQALAIFPGVSRSGSTITAGLALGLKRDFAAKFSFLLSAPIIAGAGLKSMVDVLGLVKTGAITSSDLVLFAVGMIAATITGYLVIRFLMVYLQKHTINVFVYYRLVVAAIVIIVALTRF